jgi:hypothetical protein
MRSECRGARREKHTAHTARSPQPPASSPQVFGIHRSFWCLALLLLVFSSTGASCQRPLLLSPFAPAGPMAPQVLAEGSTRDQIIAAVNANSAKVRSITATGASITIPDTMGLPILTANIAAERPNRFRMTAGTSLSGQEMDMGSNDDRFWIWIKRNQPPGVYFCRHDQFANSSIRQMMPVEPSWLLAAIGIVDIDPASVVDGPLPHGDGTVEIRSSMPSASGTLSRVTVIDARTARVVEQHIYDQTGRTLLASAVAESHQYYEKEQVLLPQKVSIRLPTANLAMKIDLGTMQINQLAGDPAQLWSMPVFAGYPQYNLGGALPNAQLPGRPPATFNQPTSPATATPIAPYPSTSPYPVTAPPINAGASTYPTTTSPSTMQAAPAYYVPNNRASAATPANYYLPAQPQRRSAYLVR